MSKEIIRQLNNLKHGDANPRAEWMTTNRALLLSQIKNTVSAQSEPFRINNIWSGLSIFFPQPLVYNVMRPIAVLLVVAMVGTSGWIATVDASYESLPGDVLYPAKYLSEKAQLSIAKVTGNTNNQIKIQSRIVKGKSEDLNKAISNPQKRDAVPDVVKDLNKEMATLALSTVGNTDAATAKEVVKNTGEVKDNLNTAQAQLTLSTSTADINLSQEIGGVANQAEAAMIGSLQVMLTKIAQGDNGATIDEVGAMIFGILDNAVKDIVNKEQQVQTINDFVSTILPTALNNNINVSTGTKALVLNATQKMVSSTAIFQSLSEQARKSLSNAIDAFNKGDLGGALDNLSKTAAPKEAAEKMANQTLAEVADAGVVTPAIAAVPSLNDAAIIVTTTGANVDTTNTVPATAIIVIASSTPEPVSTTITIPTMEKK